MAPVEIVQMCAAARLSQSSSNRMPALAWSGLFH